MNKILQRTLVLFAFSLLLTNCRKKAFDEYIRYRPESFGWDLYLRGMLNSAGRGSPSLLAIASVLFLAWPATVFGFGIWNYLLGCYPANMVTPFALLVPVFGIASGVIVLHEPFGISSIAGSLLVFAGSTLNVFGGRRHSYPSGAADGIAVHDS